MSKFQIALFVYTPKINHDNKISIQDKRVRNTCKRCASTCTL